MSDEVDLMLQCLYPEIREHGASESQQGLISMTLDRVLKAWPFLYSYVNSTFYLLYYKQF